MSEKPTCRSCAFFNFKVSGADGVAWGNCLHKDVLASQHISLSLVHELLNTPDPNLVMNAIQDYARILYREDVFGCRFHQEAP